MSKAKNLEPMQLPQGIATAPSWFWLCLMGLVVLAALLRLGGLTRHSIWYDEAFTEWIARASYVDLVTGVAKDNGTPPLFYVLSKAWLEQFGRSEVALRVPAAILGVLTVAVLTLFTCRLCGYTTALLAGLLCAISPIAVELSNEARVYAAVQLLAILSTWLFVEWRRGKQSWALALYYLATVLLCYSHYYGLAVPLVHSVVMLFAARRREQLEWLAVIGALVAAGLPWVGPFRDQLAAKMGPGSQGWILQFASTPVVQSLGRTFAWRDSGALTLAVATIIALATFTLPAVYATVRVGSPTEDRFLLAGWWLIPILVPAAAACFGLRIYHARYSVVGLPAAILLTAAGLRLMAPTVRYSLLTVLLASTSVSLVNYFVRPLKDDWRTAEAQIASNLSRDTVVVCDSDIEVIPYLYYAGRRPAPPQNVIGIVVPPQRGSAPQGVLWQKGVRVSHQAEGVAAAIDEADSIWLALCRPVGNRDAWKAWLGAHGYLQSAAIIIPPRHELLRFDRKSSRAEAPPTTFSPPPS